MFVWTMLFVVEVLKVLPWLVAGAVVGLGWQLLFALIKKLEQLEQ